MSSESSDWAPSDEHQVGSDSDEDWQPGPQRGRSRKTKSSTAAGDDSGPEDSGYTTGGYTTGEDDDDGEVELFNSDGRGGMDPLSLLAHMEEAAGEGDSHALQPFQLVRSHRRATGKARRAAAAAFKGATSSRAGVSEETGQDSGFDTEPLDTEGMEEEDEYMLLGSDVFGEEDEDEEPQPSTSTATRRPRRKGGSSGGGGSSAFGADFDEIADDPLAAKIGLVDRYDSRRRRGRGRGRGGRGRQQKKRGRPAKGQQVPEEVAKQLGQANMLYASAKYKEAAELLMGVIKVAPNLAAPYNTLGLLHEAMGNSRKALDFYMIAAHLTARDVTLWKRLAALSTEFGFFRQAIYCLSKAIAFTPGRADPDARWDRAVLYAELGELSKALAQLEQVAALRPGDPEVPKMAARLHHRTGAPQKAMGVLERHMEAHPDSTDLTHVNILAELYMEGGLFTETHALICRTTAAVAAQQAEEGTGVAPVAPDAVDAAMVAELLPMDLAAKDGLCLAQLGRVAEADVALSGLLAEGVGPAPDLYHDVGCALASMGQHSRAQTFLEALLDVEEFGMDPALWARLLAVYRAQGDAMSGANLYQSKLEGMSKDDPHFFDTAITLAELKREIGETDKALELLSTLDQILSEREAQATSTATRTNITVSATPATSQLSAGSMAAVAEAAGGAAAKQLPPALLLRKHRLHLELGQTKQFIASVLPLVQASLIQLAKDSERVADPDLPKEIARAIQRRRMLERKGLGPSRHAHQADPGSTVFKGARVRLDRRKPHIREADAAAEAYLARMESDGGVTSDGGLSDGGGRRKKPALLRAMFTDDEGMDMFTTLCKALVAEGRHQEAVEVAGTAARLCANAARWFPRARRDAVALLLVDCLMAMGHVHAALGALKPVMGRWPSSVRVWSIYSRLSAAPALVSGRAWAATVGAARRKAHDSIPAMIMQGHVYAMAKQYADALSEYFQAYRFWPSEPLLLLSIAVTYASWAAAGRPDDRNRVVLLAFAFLQAYEQARGVLHESAYNLGRAAHALGLSSIAHHYYTQALAAPAPPVPTNQELGTLQASPATSAQAPQAADGDTQKEEPRERVGLTREAAHNLALLYRSSGAPELARQVYKQYLTIV